MKKNVQRYLMTIYGINQNRSKIICEELGINIKREYEKLGENKKDEINKKIIELKKTGIGIGDELKYNIRQNIRTKIELQTRKGMRHKLRYPVRGQRTRSNARTNKKIT
jgi:small subunit ribosomal protein S13